MTDQPENKAEAPEPSRGAGEGASGGHISYMVVFLALAALTLVEILVTFTPLPRLPVLLPMALLKVALVVLFYMHLRFDNRVFAALFLMGLLMGSILIVSLVVIFSAPLLGA
jgi:cytochrome c oxidase subunit IV